MQYRNADPAPVCRRSANIRGRGVCDLWEGRDFGCEAVRSEGGGAAGVVDDVADFALVIEGDGDHIVKTNVGVDRDFDGACQVDIGMAEDAVDSEAPGFVAGDGVGYFVGGPAVGAGSTGVAGLVRRIVGDLGLVEVGAAGVAVPEDLELLVVLDEEAVDGDVVAVDDEAVCAGVGGPTDAGAVIGAPDPGVVDDGVVAVDLEVVAGAADAGAAYAEEDVVERDRVLCVGGSVLPGPIWRRTGD